MEHKAMHTNLILVSALIIILFSSNTKLFLTDILTVKPEPSVLLNPSPHAHSITVATYDKDWKLSGLLFSFANSIKFSFDNV